VSAGSWETNEVRFGAKWCSIWFGNWLMECQWHQFRHFETIQIISSYHELGFGSVTQLQFRFDRHVQLKWDLIDRFL
jgi:hypothetical protein